MLSAGVPRASPAPRRYSVDIGGPGLGGADDLGDETPLGQDALDEIALLDVLGAVMTFPPGVRRIV